MIICHCTATNDRVIRRCIDEGARDLDAIADSCGAGSMCGGCTPEISRLLASRAPGHHAPVRLRPAFVG